MRFQSGEDFSYATNSAAATCSFNLTAATRNILVEAVTVFSDLSGAVVTLQASGSTVWAMRLGGGGATGAVYHFPGLMVDIGNAQTLSGNVTATGQADISICGKYRLL